MQISATDQRSGVMELDGKTVATIAAGLVAGGGSGFATVEVTTQVEVARLEARLDGMWQVYNDRVKEAASDHQQTRDMVVANFEQLSERMTTAVNALDARITRLDERKADK